MFSDKLTKSIAVAAAAVMSPTNEAADQHDDERSRIQVGSELRVHGRPVIVDEISGDTAWCSDEDGDSVEVDLNNYDWDLMSEATADAPTPFTLGKSLGKARKDAKEPLPNMVDIRKRMKLSDSEAKEFESGMKAGLSMQEGVAEPVAQGEKNFKAAHSILKNPAVHEADQSGTGSMEKSKPKLPVGNVFSKAEDVDGEKGDEANVAAIKSSGKRATAPSAQGNPKIDEIDGEKVVDKTIAAIKSSASGNAADPKASGSKQSGAQSAEKVGNTAPSGKLGADEPKAKQRFSEPMPKALKEMALAVLLGEDALSAFDKKFANDNEKFLKQLLAGQGTDGIDVKALPLLNSFIATYGDELKKYFKLPVADEAKKDVKESADAENAEAETKSETKASELADRAVEAANRVAGLISRRVEAPSGIRRKIEEAERILSFIAEWLDSDALRDAFMGAHNKKRE